MRLDSINYLLEQAKAVAAALGNGQLGRYNLGVPQKPTAETEVPPQGQVASANKPAGPGISQGQV